MVTTWTRPGTVLLSMAACALALSSCSVINPPSYPYREITNPRPLAASAASLCPRDGVGLGAGDLRLGPGPTPGTLPADFAPAHVRLCSLRDGAPIPGGLRYSVDEKTSDVSPRLREVLTLPDQELDPRDHVACAAIYRSPTYLLLLDRQQHAIRPTLPVDPCGNPRAEVEAAIRDLQPAQVTTYTFDQPTNVDG